LTDLFDRARRVIPGGVSSPARAFKAVGGDPVFAVRGSGARLFGDDGRDYVDYIQGFGAVILGHGHPAVTAAVVEAASRGGAFGLSTPEEVRLASLVCEAMPSIERVRFVASGTEAAMTAARLARAFTGRRLIVKFDGCYHGHADEFIAGAGSSALTYDAGGMAGPSMVVLPFNDGGALKSCFADAGGDIACVFVEPVASNMGVVLPDEGFLEQVVAAARSAGSLVVLDEVVTGFRLGRSGAQGRLGLRPDLTMLGKVLGGGLPIGAVGGRAEIMDLLLPLGPVFQAGTYAAHPHAMAAGVAVLQLLEDRHFAELEGKAERLASGLSAAAAAAGACVVRGGTILSVFFASTPPRDLAAVQACDREAFARFHRSLRDQGILIAPSPFEAWFPSLAHGEDVLDQTIDAARVAFSQ
jgi:glutamate-1-semialdehyde 2,1-aminomutase